MDKIVNGVRLPMSPDEQQAHLAAQASFDLLAARRARAVLSRPDMALALKVSGYISTDADFLAFCSGQLPAALQTLIDTLPPNLRLEAAGRMAGASDFRRDSAFWTALIATNAATAEQVDALFGIA